MTNDPTKNLTMDEILRALLADVRDMKARLGALDAQAEDRSRETRPKLDLIIKEVVDVRTDLSELKEGLKQVQRELRSIDRKFDIFNKDMLAMKADLREFDERLGESERGVN